MKLTFREKSLWLLLVSLIGTFGFYFVSIFPVHQIDITQSNLMLFIGVVILLIVIQIIGNVILAIANRQELAGKVQNDERDNQISLKSLRISYYVLSFGVFCSLSAALLAPGNFIFIHVLLAFWVLAQITENTSRLILYRWNI